MVITKLSKALRVQGFTLIEVMIVVVIISILAAVALPSYQQHVMKSRRVDAKESLTRLAALQERFFFQHSRYSESLKAEALGLGAGDGAPYLTPEGWYELTLDTNKCDTTSCSYFTITAKPATGSPQLNDDRCKTFTINQALVEEATGTDADNCW